LVLRAEVIVVVEESINSIFPNIEKNTLLVFPDLDHSDVFSDLGRPSLNKELLDLLLAIDILGISSWLNGRHRHLNGCHLLLASEHASGNKRVLIMARDVGKARLDSLVLVSPILIGHQLGSISEEIKDIITNILKLLKDPFGGASDHIFWLRSSNEL